MKITNHTAEQRFLISVIKRVIVAILLTVIVFSVGKIITYFEEKAAADKMQNEILNEHVTVDTEAADSDVSEEENLDEEEASAEDEETTEDDVPAVSQSPVSTGGAAVSAADGSDGVSVDFASLTAQYPGVVGYIYGPGTKIQYPIAYTSSTNDYYLNRDLDGNLNANGSIFIEHLCDPTFANHNTIIYGHHMKSGLMFADLCKYKDPSFYTAHPYFYIYTPTQDYKVNLFAGFVCAHDDEVFALSLSSSQLANMAAKSTFQSNMGTPTGNLVTLCTCSYEFNNARYVIVGELVPMY